MKAIFYIILFAFQTYLIYLSISISDKKQKTIELTSLNCFVILFLIYDKLIFLFIAYVFLIIFILNLFRNWKVMYYVNTKMMEKFSVRDTEMLSCVEGGDIDCVRRNWWVCNNLWFNIYTGTICCRNRCNWCCIYLLV